MKAARSKLAALAAALVVAGAATTVVALNPSWLPAPLAKWRSGLAFLKPPPPPPPPPVDPLAKLPFEMTELLTHPGPDAPSGFVRLTRVKPEDFCKSLEKWGLKRAAYFAGAPPMRGWTCVTDLLKPVDGDDAKVSSLFVAVRGLESDRIDNIRMKLNLIDPATAPLVKLVARDLLTQISRGLGWDPPFEVIDALDRLREGRIYDRGITYDLRKEFGEGLRLNLIVIFPRLLGAGGEGRFVTDIRRSPVAQ